MDEERKLYYSVFRGAQVVEVLRVEVNEGDGTHDDPITRVVYWAEKDGTLIGFSEDGKDRKFRGKA